MRQTISTDHAIRWWRAHAAIFVVVAVLLLPGGLSAQESASNEAAKLKVLEVAALLRTGLLDEALQASDEAIALEAQWAVPYLVRAHVNLLHAERLRPLRELANPDESADYVQIRSYLQAAAADLRQHEQGMRALGAGLEVSRLMTWVDSWLSDIATAEYAIFLGHERKRVEEIARGVAQNNMTIAYALSNQYAAHHELVHAAKNRRLWGGASMGAGGVTGVSGIILAVGTNESGIGMGVLGLSAIMGAVGLGLYMLNPEPSLAARRFDVSVSPKAVSVSIGW